jgi:hypothetical protein
MRPGASKEKHHRQPRGKGKQSYGSDILSRYRCAEVPIRGVVIRQAKAHRNLSVSPDEIRPEKKQQRTDRKRHSKRKNGLALLSRGRILLLTGAPKKLAHAGAT